MQTVTAYTDGSSSGNPGPAGWAVFVNGELHSDWLPYATNNEAELYAILQAVMLCPPRSKLVIITDSRVSIGWLSKGWAMHKPNIRAIAEAYFAVLIAKSIVVSFQYVKGHSGDVNNVRVDKAAHAQAGIAQNVLASQ